MSGNSTRKRIEEEIAQIDQRYKELSQELVKCSSLIKEQKIKDKMLECEVKRKVLKRELEGVGA
jgi:hypothetical protein